MHKILITVIAVLMIGQVRAGESSSLKKYYEEFLKQDQPVKTDINKNRKNTKYVPCTDTGFFKNDKTQSAGKMIEVN